MSDNNGNTYRELCACYNNIHNIDGRIFAEFKYLIMYVRDESSGVPGLRAKAERMANNSNDQIRKLQQERKDLLEQAKKIHAKL